MTNSSQSSALRHSTLYKSLCVHSAHPVVPSPREIKESALSQRTSSDPSDDFKELSSLRVGLIIHRAKDGFAVRANNIHSYLESNRHVCIHLSTFSWYLPLISLTKFLGATSTLPTDAISRPLIDQKAQISADSIIGDSTQISERTSVKKSVIGSHCIIGKMAKITGSVVLDHCVIEDGCVVPSIHST
jgi:translation initiation factor eIF-2B subunit gamma